MLWILTLTNTFFVAVLIKVVADLIHDLDALTGWVELLIGKDFSFDHLRKVIDESKKERKDNE